MPEPRSSRDQSASHVLNSLVKKQTDQESHYAEDLPAIIVNDRDLRDVSAEALLALQVANDPPVLFIRGGSLVRTVHDESGSVSVESIDDTTLRGYLARAADFRRASQERGGDMRLTATSPPREIAQDILAMCSDREYFPVLAGFSQFPLVRNDGSIRLESGYDRDTQIYLDLDPVFEGIHVSEAPIDIELETAVENLLDVIHDFPFESPIDRANFIGLLIGILLRKQFPCVPMAVLDAPQPGTGKTLLGLILLLIFVGVMGPVLTPPRANSEEWWKLLASLLIAGKHIILFDNLVSRLESEALAAVLTSAIYEARILGRSQTMAVPQQATIIVTGNNVTLTEDLARRSFWIRLNAKVGDPYRRSGFRHPDLLSFVANNRRKLMESLLTLVRGWYSAGCPETRTPTIGSFENWSRIVGSILAHAGIHGFLQNFDQFLRQGDDESEQKEAFLYQVLEAFRDVRASGHGPEQSAAFTSKDLATMIRNRPGLASSLPEEIADSNRRESPVSIGKFLRGLREHRFGEAGVHVIEESESRDKIKRWRVRLNVTLN